VTEITDIQVKVPKIRLAPAVVEMLCAGFLRILKIGVSIFQRTPDRYCEEESNAHRRNLYP
jgi:hypothetical protein